MRIFITGSNGLLGQKLLHTFSTNIHELTGCDLADGSLIADVIHSYRQMDITDRRQTMTVTGELAPQVIVHTAAMTEVDRCETEKEMCWRINVIGTENVLDGASRVGAKVIFISSDYIFDGKNGPYDEEAVPNPICYYGRSKLAAENLIRGSGLDWTIIRTIVLYGCGVNVRSSFVTWLLGALRAGKRVHIVNDQWGNTTLVDDLAVGIERTLILGKSGIFNVAGRGYRTRCEFALRIAKIFNLSSDLISPISTGELRQAAPRPLRSGLVIDKAERELYISFRTMDESLKLYKNQELQASGALN